MIPSRGWPVRSSNLQLQQISRSLRLRPASARQFSTRPVRIANSAQWVHQPLRPNVSSVSLASGITVASIGSSRWLSVWGWGSKTPSAAPEVSKQTVTSAYPDFNGSTTSSSPALSPAEPVTSSSEPPPPASIDPSSNSSAFQIDSPLDQVDYTSIPEHIGYLKELGLDFGWGPTSLVQWLLEHVHVYSGLPWWGSIFTTALIIRLAVFPFFLRSSGEMAKMQAIKPEMNAIMARANKGRAEGDVLAQQQAMAEMRQLYKLTGIKAKWAYAPMILNVPLGFGAFRLTRAAANLPVPGWETGGLWWMKDLTAPDPYYITPVVFALTMHLFGRLGGDTGAAAPDQSPIIKPLMLYIFPCAAAVGMMYLPLGLHFSFLASLVIGIAQSFLMRNPRFRDFCGLPPIIKPGNQGSSTSASSTTPKSTLRIVGSYQPPTVQGVVKEAPGPLDRITGGVKQQWRDAKKAVFEKMGREDPDDTSYKKPTRSKAFMKSAQDYEKRRRKEIQEEKEGFY